MHTCRTYRVVGCAGRFANLYHLPNFTGATVLLVPAPSLLRSPCLPFEVSSPLRLLCLLVAALRLRPPVRYSLPRSSPHLPPLRALIAWMDAACRAHATSNSVGCRIVRDVLADLLQDFRPDLLLYDAGAPHAFF